MNESSILAKNKDPEYNKNEAKEGRNNQCANPFALKPLLAGEEKKTTLAIFDLRKRIKDLKKKIRKGANQEESAALAMKSDLALLKKEYYDLRETMILANTRLVMHVVISLSIRLRRASAGRIDADDLFGEGIIGLCRAIDGFDPHRGFRFSTYAICWIRQRIQRHAQNNLSILCVPNHIHEKAVKLARIKNIAEQDQGSRNNEGADILNANITALADINRLIYPKRVSLDHQISEEYELLGAEIIADSRLTPEDIAEGKDLVEKMIRTMEIFFQALTPRYREIIEKRVGAGKNAATLREIGKQMGLSHERVRQIEEIAWNKIKARASRLALERQKVPYPDLPEIVSKQKIENLIRFCRPLYALREEQK